MKKEMIKVVFDRDGVLDLDKSSYDRDSKTIHLRPGMTAGYIAYYIAYRIEELRGYRDYVRSITPETPRMTDPGRRSQKWDSAVERYHKALQDGSSIEIKRAYSEKTRERLACVLNVNSEQELTEEIWDFLYNAFGPQDCDGGKFWDLIALANWQKYQLPDPRSSRAYARSNRSGKGRNRRGKSEDESKPNFTAPTKNDLDTVRKELGVSDSTQTVAAGKTDIPGLEGMLFKGASPKVLKEAGLPPATPGPIQSPRKNPLFTRHAEEVLANDFISAVETLKINPKQMAGKTLAIHISNPTGVCKACTQGLTTDAVAGVVKQLSQKYPGLTIVITAEGGNAYKNLQSLTVRDCKIIE